MLTEQLIDESIVPMNLGWRAGIGQNVDSPTTNLGPANMHAQYRPNNGSVNSPWNQEDPLLPGKEDLWDGGIRLTYSKGNTNNVPLGQVPPSFYQDFMYEIESQVKDIQDSFKGRELDTRTSMEYRDKLKAACVGLKRRYGQYLNDGFYNDLYYKCMEKYNSDFANLKLGCNPTVEFIDANQNIYANPLLIYQYFQL
jgi:hypothetical protein